MHLTEDPNGVANGPHLYFECDDLEKRVARAESEGIVFDSDHVGQSWLWREAWLSDPAGVKLCLYHAGKNRLDRHGG